jgi:hypothetical protein
VAVQGIGRLRRDLALTVGVYRGTGTLTTAGRTLAVGAYRQAAVTAVGLLPDRPAPLVLDPADIWDRKYLGRAIDLTAQLNAASTGFTTSLVPPRGDLADFFRRTVTPLANQASFSDGLLSQTPPPFQGSRPPGEVLVGASIAVTGQAGSFDSRWRDGFAFRDQGAAWGLVALDQAADGPGLLDLVNGAINHSALTYAVATGPVAVPLDTRVPFLALPATALAPANGPGGSTPGTSQRTPGSGSRPPSPVTVPGAPKPPVTVPPAVAPVVDPVQQLVNRLLGGLSPLPK